MVNLFTYGSLMCSDIMLHVSGQAPENNRAYLDGYFCSQLQTEPYPAIVPQVGDQVEGKIYFDLDTTAINKLDTFEGEYYTRETVRVLSENKEPVTAMTYVIKPQYYHLLTKTPWSFKDFLHSGKQIFLAQYVGFSKI